MFPLGESTTKSEVTGQASEKEGSRTVDKRGGKVDGTTSGTMMWMHLVPKCEHRTVQAILPCLSNLTAS